MQRTPLHSLLFSVLLAGCPGSEHATSDVGRDTGGDASPGDDAGLVADGGDVDAPTDAPLPDGGFDAAMPDGGFDAPVLDAGLPVCGDGVVQGDELCDGDCPARCDDGVACTTDVRTGSPESCDVRCTVAPIEACAHGDGCCAPGCNATTDDDCSATCGNGIPEDLETCDGDCPASCDDGVACTTDTLVGSAESCSATCAFAPIGACTSGDGCCAPGCNAINDSDCSASCGNGVTEGTESCDGDCPASCSDGLACTTDTLVGSAASCSATCAFPPISACTSGDGCCAPGCNAINDSDCSASCGNGVTEGTESCDGDCPASCSDGLACTTDTLVGSAASCSATCAFAPISACTSGDGCCAPGCTGLVDFDCPITPPATVLINEVFYDAVGADGPTVFIELYGPPGTSLTDYRLVGVNGDGGVPYVTIALSGVIPSNGLFVIADPSAEATLLSRAALLHAGADLQNGPDSLQLRYGSALVDALGYGSFGGAVFAGEGTPALAAPAGQSLSRDAVHRDTNDNRSDFALGIPSPGNAESCAVALPPRPIYPLSAARVTQGAVPFRWELPAGHEGASVEVCTDRACSTVVASFDAVGATGMPSTSLAAGNYYWRARGRCGASLSSATSPVWQFSVARGTRTAHRSWGYSFDANADGYADAIIVDGAASSQVHYYEGAAIGLHEVRAAAASAPIEMGGDVNGDGFGDAFITTTLGTGLFLGSATGLATSATATISGTADRLGALGDIDGDGYADLAVLRSTTLDVYRGGATFSTTRSQRIVGLGARQVSSAGDVNGDGYADVLISNCDVSRSGCGGDVFVHLGSPTGLTETPAWSYLTGGNVAASGGGDIDGDGYADVVVSDLTTIRIFFGNATGLATTAGLTRTQSGAGLLGYSIAIVGDLDGDGFDDVVAGDPSAETAWTYRGPSLAAGGSLTVPDDHDFGTLVVAAGDVHGDGRDDVLVAGPMAPVPATWDFVRLFSGASGVGSSGGQVFYGTIRNRYFGTSMR